MNKDTKEVLSESMAREVKQTLEKDNIGAMIKSTPKTDIEMFINSLDERLDQRVGIVLSGIEDSVSEEGDFFENVRITRNATVGIKWRNGDETEYSWGEHEEPEKILVLSRGQPPRMSSLERLENIPSGRIRDQISELMKEKEEFQDNKPSREFWSCFQTKFGNLFDLRSFAEYAASTKKEGQEAIEAIEQEIYRIRLLPDHGLLNNTDKIRDRLEENRRLVERISNLSSADQRRLVKGISNDDAGDTNNLEKIRKFQRENSKDILSELSFSGVQDLLEKTNNGGGGGGGGKRYVPEERTAVKTAFGNKQEIEEEMQDIDERLREARDTGEDVEVETEEGTVKVQPEDSFLAFIDNFVTEKRLGGRIKDASDVEEAVENFRSLETTYYEIDGGESFEKLKKLSEREDEFSELVNTLEEFQKQRSKLLDCLDSLVNIPLMRIFGDEDLYQNIKKYLDSYREAQEILDNKYRKLEDISSTGAPKLLSDFLLLDTIAINTDDGIKMVLSPLHPLHLWRYFELVRRVENEKNDLSEGEKEFLIDAIEDQPHVLRSINTSGNRNVRDSYLIQSGERSNLPIYSELNPNDISGDKNFWEQTIRKHIQAYPPAAENLRISVVDPVNPKLLIRTLLKLHDKDLISGAKIDLVYIHNSRDKIVSQFSDQKQEDIMELFGPRGGNSFKIRTLEKPNYESYLQKIKDRDRHIFLVNDNSTPEIEEFDRDKNNEIHPLYVPKQFNYDALEDEINKTYSKEGDLFSDYQSLTNHLNNRRQGRHSSTVHQLSLNNEQISKIKEKSLWSILSSPDTNTTDFPTSDLISVSHYGERGYAVYTSDRSYFNNLLKRILNEYPVVPEKEDIQEIVDNIIDVENRGLLELVNNESRTDIKSKNVKGALGSIIAYKWLDQVIEDEKIIISIDDPVTRKWLNFRTGGRRADFLVVKFHEDDSLAFEVVEVKTVDDPEPTKFKIEDGEIEGDVVDQLSVTTSTIRALFTETSSLTSSPRMEVLKEQIFDELKDRDDLSRKEEWVSRMNNIFNSDEGEIPQVGIDPRLVSVEINNRAKTSENLEPSTENGKQIRVDRLPQETIKNALRGYIEDVEVEQEENIEDEESEETSREEVKEETERVEEKAVEDTSNGQDRDFGEDRNIEDEIHELKRILDNFGIKIVDIPQDEVEIGPNIVRYKVQLDAGVKQKKLSKRSEDIARELALENEPDIHRLSGTPYVAIDITKKQKDLVEFEEFRDSLDKDYQKGELPLIAGITPSGNVEERYLDKSPHMLVGGTTGSGKTVFLYNLVGSLFESIGPENFELGIVDPKMTEFSPFERDIPNLIDDRVINYPEDAKELIDRIVEVEIRERTEKLKESGSVDIKDHNSKVSASEELEPQVIIIDEYADLLDQLEDDSSEFEKKIRRIAQRARSVGIHLVIATQKPSAQIIDTDLRSNLDARAAFRVPSVSDSRVILDDGGAEKLSGEGDMIFKQGDNQVRIQGTFLDPDTLKKIISENSKQ